MGFVERVLGRVVKRRSVGLRLGVMLALAATLVGAPVASANGPVTKLDVCQSGCTYATLSAALAAAKGGETIVIRPGTYTESNLAITKDVTIRGAGANATYLQGAPGPLAAPNRIFHIASGVDVEISDITIRHGVAGPTVDLAGRGGAIYNEGYLTLINVAVRASAAIGADASASNPAGSFGAGGGIFNAGTLTLLDSAIINNVAQGGAGSTTGAGGCAFGAGIFNASNGIAILTNSTIYLNRAVGGNGGQNSATFSAGSKKFASDAQQPGAAGCGIGGGIFNDGGVLTMLSLTISANSAQNGVPAGGIKPSAPDGVGGGVYQAKETGWAANTLIAQNLAAIGPDASGWYISNGYNLIANGGDAYGFSTEKHDLVGTTTKPIDAKIAQLGDNGGQTPTVALLPGSPAIDAGNPAGDGTSECLDHDQRGEWRPDGLQCDIGAYEFTVEDGQSVAVSTSSRNPLAGDSVIFTISIINNSDMPISGATLSYDLPKELTFAAPVTVNPADAGTPGSPQNIVANLNVGAWKTVTVSVQVIVKDDTKPATIVYNIFKLQNGDKLLSDAVAITIGAGAGNPDQKISGLVAVNSSPTALGASTAFNAAVATGTNISYIWDFGDGASGTGPAPAHTYAATGTYTATVTASNAAGTAAAVTKVTIIEASNSTSLTVGNSSPTELGKPTVFAASLSGATNIIYSWDFGDGSPPVTGDSPSYIYSATGNYKVKLTVKSSAGTQAVELPVVIVPASTPTEPAKPNPTACADNTVVTPIYRDAIADGWWYDSWDSTVALRGTRVPMATETSETVYLGSKSVAFTAQVGYAGLVFHSNNPFDTTAYSGLVFAARATQAGQRISMYMFDSDGRMLTQVHLIDYGGDPVPSQWKVYCIPLADMGANATKIQRIVFEDETGQPQPALYLDEIGFTGWSNAPVNPSSTATIYIPRSQMMISDAAVENSAG